MLVPVRLTVPLTLVDYLAENGHPPHPAKQGYALIDTGAALSAVDDRAMGELGIPVIASVETATPHGIGFSNVYNASVSIDAMDLDPMDLHHCFGCYLGEPLEGSPLIISLLGRDLLNRFVLTYDGPGGTATLNI